MGRDGSIMMCGYNSRNLIILFIIFLSESLAGCAHSETLDLPHGIGFSSLSLYDTTRNRTVTAEAYYPAESAGNDVPLAPGVFPVIVFGHGYTIGIDYYSYLWQSLVPDGFIVVLPTTESGLFPNHLTFAGDMSFLLEEMSVLHADPASLFFQHISARRALMGHSMGGGAAFLAAAMTETATTLVTFAAAETNPSAIEAASGLTLPCLLLAGSNDCVTPPATHQQPMFEALASACRTLVSLIGASHCQFAANNSLCVLAETSAGCSAAISLTEQETLTLDLVHPWLQFFLKSEAPAWIEFENRIETFATAGSIEADNRCSPMTATPAIGRPGLTILLISGLLFVRWR